MAFEEKRQTKGIQMKEKDKSDLQVVSQEDSTDKEVRSIMEEIKEENDILDELEEKIRQHKKRYIKKVSIVIVTIVLALSGGVMYVMNQTYTDTRILNTYSDGAEDGAQYIEFAGGILKYTRDGAAFLDNKGKEKWNAAYQIQTPIASVKKNAVAIADKGGNDISVFGKNGLKGEIHTNLPIEKTAVSSQGIVSAILKDGNTFRIVCYDAAGNVLVEHKTSPTVTGYPMDIDISDNGYMLLVSYLIVEDGVLTGRVAYYNFGDAGKNKEDYIVTQEVYPNAVIPTVFFMDDQTSVVVSDREIVIYKGKDVPEKLTSVKMTNGMKSVFYNEKSIGVVSNGKEGNVLHIFDKKGRSLLTQKFEGEYKNAKISDNLVIMYNGKQCAVFSKGGVQRFAGEFDTDIFEIKPLLGLNKYLVINANGFEEVRFTK